MIIFYSGEGTNGSDPVVVLKRRANIMYSAMDSLKKAKLDPRMKIYVRLRRGPRNKR